MNNKNYVIIGAVSAVFVVGIATFLLSSNINPQPEIDPLDIDKEIFKELPDSEIFSASQTIKKISSESELRQFLSKVEQSYIDERVFFDDFAMNVDLDIRPSVEFEPVPEPEPRMAVSDSSESFQLARSNTGSVSLDASVYVVEEHSTTNVQVQNVDEPDFLKNDGKYVYILSDDRLTIIDGYPAEDAKIILKMGLDIERQDLDNMFLNDDRLVIFYRGDYEMKTISEYDFAPDYRHKRTAHALVLDVSDKDNPIILKDYEVDGRYKDARMIGNYVYFITREGIDYHRPIMPVIQESSETILRPDVFYFDNPERDYNFNTITAFDIFGDSINSETFLMGDADTIYVSEDSIYITYQKNLPHHYFESLKKDRFFEVIVPLLPTNIQEQIKSIDQDSTLDWYQKWEKTSELLQDTYNQMSDTSRNLLFKQIQQDLEEYDAKFIKSSTRTVIHKITIDKENLEYFDKSEVPGYLLNQFSMDESDDRFRIATTSSYNGRFASFTHNNVYVLDENLKQVGSLENIAPDETIFSARFMGDKLYLVTFERIDPFFVIDLSQDNPKVLGELKIPGFSNYLHPYDQDHIIGIGRDTEDKNGRVTTLGLKLALFDVSDFHNPTTVDTITIGTQSTDSEVLYNHKALLFDKEKNILSMPVRDYERLVFEDVKTGEVRKHSQNWLGFYVYGIDPDKGFDLKGEIEHYSGNGHDYRFDDKNRSFYIGDVVYTVSYDLVKMNNLNEISSEINKINLHDGPQIVKYLG